MNLMLERTAFRQAAFKQAVLVTLLAAVIALGAGPRSDVYAQTLQSRLFDITKNKRLRVCQYPQYYSISYRDPSTGQLSGIDVDLSKELAKELGAELEVVESNFGTFIADLQTNKCEIGMFAIGATLKRAQAVEFSKPYLITSIYGVTRKGGPIKAWADIDKSGVKAAALLGSYIEGFMKDYLKKGEVVSVAPPNTREGELMAHRADVILTDYPTAIKVTNEFDWAETITPDEPLAVTPYAYVVPQGDQIWLNYVNLFVDTIKRDGRLKKFAEKYQLGPIVAP
jgi:cyclohexadienyl dehydratase